MLAALCDGREDFVIVEDGNKRTEFVQFSRMGNDSFYCETAVDPEGDAGRKLLSTPSYMTMRQVNDFLDYFESGEPLLPYLTDWKEESWRWKEEEVKDDASLLSEEGTKRGILLILALIVLVIVIVVEWCRY